MNSFELVDKEKIEELDINYSRYAHKSGVNVIFCNNNDNCETVEFNISFRTPAINNKGVTHIIEHCIASELLDVSYFKQTANTYQDKTSYQYIVSKNNIEHIEEILEKIFFPEYKHNKNIFLREGWRLNLTNGKEEILGIVFNEIMHVSRSPLKSIIRYVPYSLYYNSIYGNVSGGELEDIVTVQYKETIDYHNRFYVPSNCCIYIYGTNNEELLLKKISTVVDKLEREYNKKYYFRQEKTNFKRMNPLMLKYRTVCKEKKDSFISINYEIDKVENQEQYNAYLALVNLFMNNSIFDEKSRIGFINSLYRPYIAIVLTYCDKDDMTKFEKYCKKVLLESVSILKEIDINNFILDRIKANGKVNYLYLGRLIMEAFFSDINPLKYLKSNKEFNKDEFLISLKKTFSDEEKVSKIILESTQENCNSQLIKKAKNYGVVGEYKEIKAKEKNLSIKSKDVQLSDVGMDAEVIIKPNRIEDINKIKYYLYNTNNDKINVHIYFNISSFKENEISYIALICKYFQCEYAEKDRRINFLTCSFEEGEIYFIVNINCSKCDFKNEVNELFTRIISYNIDILKIEKIMQQIYMRYKLNVQERTEWILLYRVRSYLSNKYLCEDLLEGLGFYKFIKNNMSNINKESVLNIVNLIKNSCSFISIYGRDNDESITYLTKAMNRWGVKGEYFHDIREVNAINEKFLINAESSYIAIGCDINNYGYKGTEKDKLLAKMISNKYIIPELRRQCNAYSGALILEEDNVIFSAIMTQDIPGAVEVFNSVYKYVEENKVEIIEEFNMYKGNYIGNIRNASDNEFNDKATLRLRYPKKFKFRSEIIKELDEFTEKDIEEFLNIITLAQKNNYYCVIGNNECVFDKEFHNIEVL